MHLPFTWPSSCIMDDMDESRFEDLLIVSSSREVNPEKSFMLLQNTRSEQSEIYNLFRDEQICRRYSSGVNNVALVAVLPDGETKLLLSFSSTGGLTGNCEQPDTYNFSMDGACANA